MTFVADGVFDLSVCVAVAAPSAGELAVEEQRHAFARGDFNRALGGLVIGLGIEYIAPGPGRLASASSIVTATLATMMFARCKNTGECSNALHAAHARNVAAETSVLAAIEI